MTGSREVGVLLIVLGLLYAVSYVAWLYVARLRRSPAQASTRPQARAWVQDWRTETETGSQSHAEVAMPQDGTP
jgi:hypothetical protein